MLRKARDLQGYKVQATDGEIGHVSEFYFDDVAWMLRYVVVETGGWLSSREVLIAPEAFGLPDWPVRELPVDLTRDQVKGSPRIDTDKPVSRQHELDYRAYFGWPPYWTGAVGAIPPPMSPPPEIVKEMEVARDRAVKQGDPHLRSSRAVTGYAIEAEDGEIGHVDDFLVDDETWFVRYLVIDTRNWWPGKDVLLPPQWISEIDWSTMKVRVDLSRETIKSAPEYNGSAPIGRDYEAALHQHYNRAPYWITT